MKKSGITMIALIVTIAVMLILVTVSISTIVNKRYFSKAEEVSFTSNFDNYKSELEDYIGNQDVIYNGRYNSSKLFADKNGIYYGSEIIDGQNIKEILPTISEEYIDNIKVYQGRLVYTGEDEIYKNKVNGTLSYDKDNSLIEYESSRDNMSAQGGPLEVTVGIDGDFSVELVYKQMEYSYVSSKNNFIHSDGFMIYETSENGNVYFGINDIDGQEVEFALRQGKIDKISFTYDSKQKLGTIYINGERKTSKIFTSSISSFNKIYISGDREYYSLRVYDKCLNYSEIKQNDIKDIVMYGAWEAI